MRTPRLPLCVLECARAAVELVGLESPWLVSGHTSILARYYDHKKTVVYDTTRHGSGCLSADYQQSRSALYATHATKLQRR